MYPDHNYNRKLCEHNMMQSAKQCKKGSFKISREFWSLYFSHLTPLAVNIFVHTLHGLYIAANFSPENGWKCLHTLAPRLAGVLGGESSKYAQKRKHVSKLVNGRNGRRTNLHICFRPITIACDFRWVDLNSTLS